MMLLTIILKAAVVAQISATDQRVEIIEIRLVSLRVEEIESHLTVRHACIIPALLHLLLTVRLLSIRVVRWRWRASYTFIHLLNSSYHFHSILSRLSQGQIFRLVLSQTSRYLLEAFRLSLSIWIWSLANPILYFIKEQETCCCTDCCNTSRPPSLLMISFTLFFVPVMMFHFLMRCCFIKARITSRAHSRKLNLISVTAKLTASSTPRVVKSVWPRESPPIIRWELAREKLWIWLDPLPQCSVQVLLVPLMLDIGNK